MINEILNYLFKCAVFIYSTLFMIICFPIFIIISVMLGIYWGYNILKEVIFNKKFRFL